MRKYLLLAILQLTASIVFPEQVTLILKSTNGDTVQYVDRNITELSYIKTAITGIEGLKQLTSLRSITFDKTPFIEDYSFLQDVPWIKKLVLVYGPNTDDWTFVEHLYNLEILFIGSYKATAFNLDLRNNKALIYLAVTGGNLETFPCLLNIPKTLKYLNVALNKITSLPANFNEYKDIIVFLRNNPIEDTKYENVVLDWAENVLPKEFIIPY
jgi:Leucine-rich repeat (LRR) protein